MLPTSDFLSEIATVLLLESGRSCKEASTARVLSRPSEPYLRSLLEAALRTPRFQHAPDST
jgi:ABC-type glutathione transport system ATPase component